MKKTLLLFAMLLGVVGAWAEGDKFVTPEAGKYYIIKGDHATHLGSLVLLKVAV